MNWIYGIKRNKPIPWSSFTCKIYVKTDFIFMSFYDTYAKHQKEITWSLLRFWTFFIGSWIRFGVTVRVCCTKMAVWAKQPCGGDSAPRILRMLIWPPANFRQSFVYFWAILCILLGNPLGAVSQKSRFFLVQRNFPLYTRGLLGCLLRFWSSRPKPCRDNYYY